MGDNNRFNNTEIKTLFVSHFICCKHRFMVTVQRLAGHEKTNGIN